MSFEKYKKVAGVYIIRNKINNKTYIGSSINLQKRLSTHKSSASKKNSGLALLNNAFKKYNADDFDFSVVEIVALCRYNKNASSSILAHREQVWIDSYMSNTREHGYNLRIYASSNFGYRFKRESSHWTGKHHTDETKIKISLANKGKKRDIKVKYSEYECVKMGKRVARLSEDEVLFIRKSTLPRTKLARIFHIPLRHVFKIRSRERYWWVPDEVTGDTSRQIKNKLPLNKPKLTNAQVIYIKASSLKQRELAEMFNVPVRTIGRVKQGKRYKNVKDEGVGQCISLG